MRGGYIKLYRRMTEWGWYSDPGTRAVFLHLLLTANYAPSEYMGRRIERGQVVFRYRKLADDLGIGVRVARTALERLKLTQELTLEPTHKFCVATLVNYSKYQCSDEQADTQTDTPSDTQTTHSRHTADTHSKNIRKEEEVRVPPSESSNELSSPQGEAAKVKKSVESVLDGWEADETVKAAMAEFVANRRTLRKPMTPRAVELAIGSLRKLAGEDAERSVAIINQSIERSWQGLFDLQDGTTQKQARKEEVHYERL